MRFKPPSPGSHRYQRFPRTGEFKLAVHSTMADFSPNRPQKFRSWLATPLTATAGRMRRLAREFHKKPARAARMLARIQSANAILDKMEA